MAIVKATYTRNAGGAKASVRYIEHRPGKEGKQTTRTLFNSDGKMEREEAYQMIDEAARGMNFFRFVISPDPQTEDSQKDLYLRDITEQTMLQLEQRIQTSLNWVAAEHNDHAPHRHVHVIAVVPGKLYPQDFQAMRQTATQAALEQRRERDTTRKLQQQQERELWERHR